jgi:hypothetical protein
MSPGYTLLRPHLIVMILEIPGYPLSDSFGETGGPGTNTLIRAAIEEGKDASLRLLADDAAAWAHQ